MSQISFGISQIKHSDFRHPKSEFLFISQIQLGISQIRSGIYSSFRPIMSQTSLHSKLTWEMDRFETYYTKLVMPKINSDRFGIYSDLEHRFIPNLKFDLGRTKSEFQFGISQS